MVDVIVAPEYTTSTFSNQDPSAPSAQGSFALVKNILDETGTFAEEAHTRALAAIEKLGNFTVTVPTIAAPVIPVTDLEVTPIGEAPVTPGDLTAVFPVAPAEPALGGISIGTMPDAPEFLDASPELADIAIPDPFSAAVPTEPSLEDVNVPVATDIALPDVPALAAFNLPDAPTLDLPVFDATIGNLPTAPDTEFAWSEVEYNTALLTQMNSRLLDFVSGASTGLSNDVEQAIYNRARDRQAEITQGTIDEANRNIAARGFKVPTGVLTRLVQQALQSRLQKDSDISREIMIKQAELEQANFQFAFTTAVQLESRLIEHANNVQNRAFEAARFTFQALIEIFNAKVNLFNADVQAFGVRAEVFKSRLQAELARLEIYKAQLEGQKLISQLNESQVRVYSAQVEAVKTKVDVFNSQVESAKARIQAQQAKVEIYRAKLQGYATQVQAKTAEYQGYASRIQAEVVKVEAFSAKAQAFKSRTDAYSALVTAKLGEQTLNFKQSQEFPLEVYKQKILAHQSAVEAEAKRVESLVDVYKTQVDAFSATETAKATNTNSKVEVMKANTNVSIEQAKLAIQTAQTNTQLAIAAHETAQTSARAAGQLSGQLASASLAARNVSAGISSSDTSSVSNAFNSSYSTSTNANTNANTSVSVSSSDSNITITQN